MKTPDSELRYVGRKLTVETLAKVDASLMLLGQTAARDVLSSPESTQHDPDAKSAKQRHLWERTGGCGKRCSST